MTAYAPFAPAYYPMSQYQAPRAYAPPASSAEVTKLQQQVTELSNALQEQNAQFQQMQLQQMMSQAPSAPRTDKWQTIKTGAKAGLLLGMLGAAISTVLVGGLSLIKGGAIFAQVAQKTGFKGSTGAYIATSTLKAIVSNLFRGGFYGGIFGYFFHKLQGGQQPR